MSGSRILTERIFAFRRRVISSYKKLFKELVDSIRKLYNDRVTIILFGSRASKTNRESSDFDIFVVLEKISKEDLKLIYSAKPDFLPTDIILITPADLKNPVIKSMMKTSEIIFDGLNLFETKP